MSSYTSAHAKLGSTPDRVWLDRPLLRSRSAGIALRSRPDPASRGVYSHRASHGWHSDRDRAGANHPNRGRHGHSPVSLYSERRSIAYRQLGHFRAVLHVQTRRPSPRPLPGKQSRNCAHRCVLNALATITRRRNLGCRVVCHSGGHPNDPKAAASVQRTRITSRTLRWQRGLHASMPLMKLLLYEL
jgi:hypothetical protein